MCVCCCRVDDDAIDADADAENDVVEFTTKWPFCLTIIKKFDTLIVGMIINNKKGDEMKTRLIALATAHNKVGEQKKTALLQNLERDWEEYIIAPYYDEEKKLWYGSGQYMLDTSAREAFTAYICYLDHDDFAVDTWEEKVGEHKTIIHQAVKFYGEL